MSLVVREVCCFCAMYTIQCDAINATRHNVLAMLAKSNEENVIRASRAKRASIKYHTSNTTTSQISEQAANSSIMKLIIFGHAFCTPLIYMYTSISCV